MKGVLSLVVGGILVFAASTGMSATSLDANWICTTNASSSSVDTEKAADEKMGNTASSAKDAFDFASKNCRDCTKITCEVQSK